MQPLASTIGQQAIRMALLTNPGLWEGEAMRAVCWVLMLSLALAAGSGCGGEAPAPPVAEPIGKMPATSKFASRLEAAKAISFVEERDRALVEVARDAAAAGDSEVVTEALKKIGFIELRDDTAADCAAKLAKAGKESAAVAVAKTIQFVDRRDQVLRALAKGTK
jgi:hypothetical protein